MQLREYQFDGFNQVTYKNKGRFIIPTGGGKTPLEATILASKLSNNVNSIGLVLAPRIVLIQQLMYEYRNKVFTPGHIITTKDEDVLFEVCKSYRFIAFHSGEHEPDYSEPWFQIEDGEELKPQSWKEIATTDYDQVIVEIEKARKLEQIPIIFSTYHSCFKLSDIEFNTVICDESHFISQEIFFDNFSKISAKNKYFFTATERHTYSDKGRGLNNESFYGKVLFRITPKKLQDLGYITGIKLHIQDFITSNRETTYVSEIIEALDKNIKLSSSLPQFKIIISTPGTKFIKIVEDNIEKLKKYNCPIFSISSKNGPKINNESVDRQKFMNEIKKAENAIIFHYDILAEGIDIDGITGVIINRIMAKSKAVQTFGRAMRVYKANPDLKPYAWITITCPNHSEDTKEFFKELIDDLIEEGFELNELFDNFDNTDKHAGDEDGVKDAYGVDKKASSNASAEEMEHFVYDRKMERALDEWIDKDMNDLEVAFSVVGKLFKEMQ